LAPAVADGPVIGGHSFTELYNESDAYPQIKIDDFVASPGIVPTMDRYGAGSWFTTAAFAIGDDLKLLSALVGGLIASVGAAVAFCFSSDTSVRARQDVLDATFKMGMVPELKGLMRENAISVRVQHAEARTHLRGRCPDARVDVQAPNVGTRNSLNR
jgi:hypothetical protein